MPSHFNIIEEAQKRHESAAKALEASFNLIDSRLHEFHHLKTTIWHSQIRRLVEEIEKRKSSDSRLEHFKKHWQPDSSEQRRFSMFRMVNSTNLRAPVLPLVPINIRTSLGMLLGPSSSSAAFSAFLEEKTESQKYARDVDEVVVKMRETEHLLSALLQNVHECGNTIGELARAFDAAHEQLQGDESDTNFQHLLAIGKVLTLVLNTPIMNEDGSPVENLPDKLASYRCEAAATAQEDFTGITVALGCSTDSLNEKLLDAAKSGDTKEVERLLDRGADANAAEEDGWTALMYAAALQRIDTVRLLLTKGAETHRKNAAGRTALEIATGLRHGDIAILLMQSSQQGKQNVFSTNNTIAHPNMSKDKNSTQRQAAISSDGASLYDEVEKAITDAFAIIKTSTSQENLTPKEQKRQRRKRSKRGKGKATTAQTSTSSLESYAEKLLAEVRKRKELAEFKRLTIAFYGETRTGKSTIIETLRILLNEKTKQQEREKFREAGESSQEQPLIQNEIRQMAARIASGESDAAVVLPRMQALLQQEEEANRSAQASWQDGAIIGDGRHDFTRSSKAYEFECNGTEFSLLDVPGIEGDEKEVLDEIERAVKKAHAIFYVTRAKKPPESGTIEKIRAQLCDYTGVWALFNKSCPSPQKLTEPLLNDEEQKGLAEMDIMLSETLGSAWQGIKTVSAQPAFFACADCLLPDNPGYGKRRKFRDHLPPEALLQRSGMDALRQFICSDLLAGAKQRIQNANRSKLSHIIENALQYMSSEAKKCNNLLEQAEEEATAAAKQIMNATRSAEYQFKREAHNMLEDEQSQARRKIYDYIDTDISDEQLQNFFNQYMQELRPTLVDKFSRQTQKIWHDWLKKVQEILEKYRRHMDDIVSISEAPLVLDDSQTGLKESRSWKDWPWGEAIGAAVAAAGAITGGGAWVIGGAVVALGSLGYRIYKWFQGKKKTQKKRADEGIRKEFEKLRAQFDSQCEKIIRQLQGEAAQHEKAPSEHRKRRVDFQEKFKRVDQNLQKLLQKLQPSSNAA